MKKDTPGPLARGCFDFTVVLQCRGTVLNSQIWSAEFVKNTKV